MCATPCSGLTWMQPGFESRRQLGDILWSPGWTCGGIFGYFRYLTRGKISTRLCLCVVIYLTSCSNFHFNGYNQFSAYLCFFHDFFNRRTSSPPLQMKRGEVVPFPSGVTFVPQVRALEPQTPMLVTEKCFRRRTVCKITLQHMIFQFPRFKK